MSYHQAVDVSQNRILFSLPSSERDILESHLRPKEVHFGETLVQSDEPINFLFFPFDAAISMLNTEKQSSQTVDIALIGKEGCFGCSVVQGTNKSPSMFMVQVAGTGVEVATAALLTELPRLQHLRGALDRYNYLLTRLITISVGCSQFHSPDQRLARWLIVHTYRTGITTYPFSNEFLAAQVGLDADVITSLLTDLAKHGIVESGQNTVILKHLQALETRSCICFTLAKQATAEYLLALEDIH